MKGDVLKGLFWEIKKAFIEANIPKSFSDKEITFPLFIDVAVIKLVLLLLSHFEMAFSV